MPAEKITKTIDSFFWFFAIIATCIYVKSLFEPTKEEKRASFEKTLKNCGDLKKTYRKKPTRENHLALLDTKDKCKRQANSMTSDYEVKREYLRLCKKECAR